MKCEISVPDAEWQIKLKERKEEASKTMLRHDLSKSLYTFEMVSIASRYWKVSNNSAECKLSSEYIPDDLLEKLMKV